MSEICKKFFQFGKALLSSWRVNNSLSTIIYLGLIGTPFAAIGSSNRFWSDNKRLGSGMNMDLGRTAATLVLAAGMAFNAEALTITPGTLATATGNQTSQSQINTAIAPIIGSASLLYKQDVGGPETGSLAGSYETTFYNTALDPKDALIDYVGGPIVAGTAWLLVKDGNNSPAWYLFNLTTLGWNGTDDLNINNFWPGNGAIGFPGNAKTAACSLNIRDISFSRSIRQRASPALQQTGYPQ
jgi:hypothetical protein